jgi:F0F1-type ATP synthase assembly protein I
MATPGKPMYQSRKKNLGTGKYPLISRKAGVLVAMALELPGSIVGGIIIGHLLDEYFKTAPWLMMALTILGFTAACIRLVRWVRFFSEKRNEPNSAERNHSAS